MSMGNIPSTSITPISLTPLPSSMPRIMIMIITTTTTMTTAMNHNIITSMNQTSIHITLILILNHHHPRPNRPRILPPLPATPTFPVCPLALKKGHILRLEKTRHRVTSNGILNRQRRRSTSPSLQSSPSPI